MLFRDYLVKMQMIRKMTNAQLAEQITEVSGKVIDEAHVGKWLRGRQKPNKEYARAIATVFEKPFVEIWNMIQEERLISTHFSRLARYIGEDLDLLSIVDESARQLLESKSQDEKNATFMRLNYKNLTDIEWILSFDHDIYPTQSPVTRQIMQGWLKSENCLSFVLKFKGELKAFCVAIPISDKAFEEILHGRQDESDLSPDDIKIEFKNFYVYSNMADGAYYAGQMLARIAFLFNIYNMKRIGGLVVTDDEDRLCKKLGLSPVWVDSGFPTKFKPTTYFGDIETHEKLGQVIKNYKRYIEIIKS